MPGRFASFEEFWPFYLARHARSTTRAVHVGGPWLTVLVLLTGIALWPWWLVLLALAIGYGAAWVSHLLIERNRPATFAYPAVAAWGPMAGLAAGGAAAARDRLTPPKSVAADRRHYFD